MSVNSVVFVLGKGRNTWASRKAWRARGNCKYISNICIEVASYQAYKFKMNRLLRLIKSFSGLAANNVETSLFAASDFWSENFSDRTVCNVVPHAKLPSRIDVWRKHLLIEKIHQIAIFQSA